MRLCRPTLGHGAVALLTSVTVATAIGCGSVARVPEQTYLGASSQLGVP